MISVSPTIICNLVVPGFVPQPVREKFEDIAHAWNVLLVGDLKDEHSFDDVETGFRAYGDHEFLKRPDAKASADVVTVGYLKVRDAHWFEKKAENADERIVITSGGACPEGSHSVFMPARQAP